MSYQQNLLDYVRKKYHSEVEYPFNRFPTYGVLRHRDNQKCYAMLSSTTREKLGLVGSDRVELLSVKLNDLLLRDFLMQRDGVYPERSFRGNWISILLDGTIPQEEILSLLDESYRITASTATKKAIRLPKEWLLPANPKIYDVETAFAQAEEIDWKQGAGVKKGDTVFLYVAAPISAIVYRCIVTETDIPFRYDNGNVHVRTLMKIRLEKRYPQDRFTFDVLGRDYGIRAVRGPRGIPTELSEALNEE